MSEQFEGFVRTTIETWEEGMDAIDRLYQATQPETVFGRPIEAHGQTVITASEVSMGVGFGFGGGAGGSEPPAGEGEESETGAPPDEAEAAGEDQETGGVGGGMGGGGGGTSAGRPVAVIRISEDGVEVEPIVDVTKIALAMFTALGSMFFMARRMKKASRK